MMARSKNSGGCSAQTRRRTPLKVSMRPRTSGSAKRRPKSPSVVGSGMRRGPGAGGGVGDASGAERAEVGLVVAAELDMFEASPAGEEVERDVQDVVGFVVGE